MVKLPPDSFSTYLASVSIPAVNARGGPQTERFHATLGLFWALAGNTAAIPSITPSASLPDCVIADPPRNVVFFGLLMRLRQAQRPVNRTMTYGTKARSRTNAGNEALSKG